MTTAFFSNKSKARFIAVCLAVVAIFSVQTGVSLSVPVIHEYGPLSTSALRLCWAALALLLFVRPPLFTYTRTQWRAAVILGSGMAAMSLFFFLAIERLPQHLTVALEFCGPLTVAAFGIRGWKSFLWPLMAALGIILLLFGDINGAEQVDNLGVLFAFMAATGWATYIIMMKKIGSSFIGLQGLSISLFVAALISIPFAVYETGTFIFPWRQLLIMAGLAILVPLVPYILEIQVLRRLSAPAFGVLMSLEPAVGALLGWLILDQGMGLREIIGIAFVVVASVGVVKSTNVD